MEEWTGLFGSAEPDRYTGIKEILDQARFIGDDTDAVCNGRRLSEAIFLWSVNLQVVKHTEDLEITTLELGYTECHLSEGRPQRPKADENIKQIPFK